MQLTFIKDCNSFSSLIKLSGKGIWNISLSLSGGAATGIVSGYREGADG
jgi:hypothetical protein